MGQQVMEVGSVRRPGRWRDDWPVAVAAAAAAALVWGVAEVQDVDLAVRSGSGTQHIGLASVVVTALVVAMVGAGLLRALERRTTRARAVWTGIAVAVWVVSLAGPLGARSPSAGAALAALHVVVGGIVVVGLRRRHAGRVA